MTDIIKEPGSKKKRSRWVSRIARLLLLILFIAGFFFSALPWGRAAARATFILPSLITAQQPAPLVLTGEPIKHVQLTTPSSNGTVYLDVYEPASNQAPALNTNGGVLIIPGAGDNRKVDQLINLSEALARSGLTVMDMTTPALMRYDIEAQDSDAVVKAYQKLAQFPTMHNKHIGLIAFSAGAPLACFAAADPRIQKQVAYVVAFGGYFNTRNVLQAFGQRSITIDGHSEAWHPTAVPIEVLGNLITQDLPTSEQQTILQAIAQGHTLTSKQLQAMQPDAQAAYHLLQGDEPRQVDENIAKLPQATQKQLVQLSPGRVITQIAAPIFLLHDRNDASLPVTESRDFAAALARLHHPYDYVEFHIFDHVEVQSHPQTIQLINDGSHLFSLLTQILYISAR